MPNFQYVHYALLQCRGWICWTEDYHIALLHWVLGVVETSSAFLLWLGIFSMITNIYIYIYICNIYRALLLRIERCKTEKSKQKTSYIYIYTLQLHVINSGSSVLGTTSIRTLTIRVLSFGGLVYHFSVVNRVSLLIL